VGKVYQTDASFARLFSFPHIIAMWKRTKIAIAANALNIAAGASLAMCVNGMGLTKED
jgi:hypothetical protein